MKEKVNFTGVNKILYDHSYSFVIANGGSVEEAHLAGIRKVESVKKLRSEIVKSNFKH